MDKLLDEFYCSTRVVWEQTVSFQGLGDSDVPRYSSQGICGEKGFMGCGYTKEEENRRLEERRVRQEERDSLPRPLHASLPVADAIGLHITFDVEKKSAEKAYAKILGYLEALIAADALTASGRNNECELRLGECKPPTITTFSENGATKPECVGLHAEMAARNRSKKLEYEALVEKLEAMGGEISVGPDYEESAADEWYVQSPGETKTNGLIVVNCHKGTGLYRQLFASGWLHRAFPTQRPTPTGTAVPATTTMAELLDEFYRTTHLVWGLGAVFQGLDDAGAPQYISVCCGLAGSTGCTGDPVEDAKEAERKRVCKAKCEEMARAPHADFPIARDVRLCLTFDVDEGDRAREAYAQMLGHLKALIEAGEGKNNECKLRLGDCKPPTTTTFRQRGALKAECVHLHAEMTERNRTKKLEFEALVEKLQEFGAKVWQGADYEVAKGEWYVQNPCERRAEGRIIVDCHKDTGLYQDLLASGWLHRGFPEWWRRALVTCYD